MSMNITTKNQVKRVGMYPPTTIEDHKVAKWKKKYSNFIDSGSASPMIPFMVTQVIKWFNLTRCCSTPELCLFHL